MRAVPVLRDDLESLNRLLVPDDIVQNLRPILFYPMRAENPHEIDATGVAYHGNSYALLSLLAGVFPFAMVEVIYRARACQSRVTPMLNTSRVLQRLRNPPTALWKVSPPPSSLLSPGPTRAYSAVNEPSSTSLPRPRLDYRSIAENAVFKSQNAFNRKAGLPVRAIQTIKKLYAKQKKLSGILNSKKHARTRIGDRIQTAAREEDATAKQAALEDAKTVKAQILELERRLVGIEDRLYDLASSVPNDTHPDVPIGPEKAAVILSTHGPAPLPADPARDHVAIGKVLGLFDFEAGSQVTGSSWYYLTNEGALLEMALTNYALSTAVKHGFSPVITPDVVRTDIARRCGFQPRDHIASQSYHVSTVSSPPSSSASEPSKHTHADLVLAGTAEIPLAGMFANKITPSTILPQKIVGYGRAFRAEAGARGTDTRGLYRVHQFTKVELFAVSKTAESEALMEEIRKIQVEIFEGLGLSFRYCPHRLAISYTGS